MIEEERRLRRAQQRSKMTDQIVALLLFSVSLGLRVFRLGDASYWIDEILQLNASRVLWDHGLIRFVMNENLPPLSHLLTEAAVRIGGTAEGIVRFPSAFLGALTSVFVYHAARLLLGRRVAIASACFAAMSPFLVWYAQEARMYAMVACASSAALAAYASLLASDGSSRTAVVCMGFSASFGVMLHPYFVLFLPGLILHAWWRFGFRHQAFRSVVVSLLVAALCLAGWIIATLETVLQTVTSQGHHKPHGLLYFFPYSVFSMLFGHTLGPTLLDFRISSTKELFAEHWVVLLVSALAVLGVVAVELSRLRRSEGDILALLLLSSAFPAALAVLFAVGTGIGFNARYVAVATPSAVVLLGYAIGDHSIERLHKIPAFIVAGFMVISITNLYWNAEYNREDIRSATTYLARRVDVDDIVIVSSGSVARVIEHYAPSLSPKLLSVFEVDERHQLSAVLATTESSGDVWLLESRSWESDPQGLMLQFLSEHLTQVKDERFHGVGVSRFRRE